MSHLDGMANKFREMERKKKKGAFVDENGIPLMSPEAILETCRENDGYETPELNDTLLLHFRGYRKIENLEPYTELKALWLGSNGLGKIEGISHLSKLRCLYLQQNLLNKIENLEGLTSLVQLDVSQNQLKRLENLSCLPNLETLNTAKNGFDCAEEIEELACCPALTNVDLSGNNLTGEAVLDVLIGIPKLVAVNIAGNPVVGQTPQFRKKLITRIPSLKYLDRPIFDVERVGALAWAEGGVEAERKAKQDFHEAKRQAERKQMQDFRDWQKQRRAEYKAGVNVPARLAPEELARREGERRAAAEAAAAREAAALAGDGVARLAKAYWRDPGADIDDLIEEQGRRKELEDQARELGAREAAAAAAATAEQKMEEGEQGNGPVEQRKPELPAPPAGEGAGRAAEGGPAAMPPPPPPPGHSPARVEEDSVLSDSTPVRPARDGRSLIAELAGEDGGAAAAAAAGLEGTPAKLPVEPAGPAPGQGRGEGPARGGAGGGGGGGAAAVVWTADLDRGLRNAAEALDYDFAAVAELLPPEGLTADACRRRFAELEALEESEEEEEGEEEEEEEEEEDEFAKHRHRTLEELARDERLDEYELEMIKEERVAESLAIYRRQLAEKDRARARLAELNARDPFLLNGPGGAPRGRLEDAWEGGGGGGRELPPAAAAAAAAAGGAGVWEEGLDMALARVVGAAGPGDFGVVAAVLAGDPGTAAAAARAGVAPGAAGAEACRRRWAYLDAQNWAAAAAPAAVPAAAAAAELSPSTPAPAAAEVSGEWLEQLKAMAGRSYEELSRANFASKYLRPPASLPSMALDEDSDGDDSFDEEDGLEEEKKREEGEKMEVREDRSFGVMSMEAIKAAAMKLAREGGAVALSAEAGGDDGARGEAGEGPAVGGQGGEEGGEGEVKEEAAVARAGASARGRRAERVRATVELSLRREAEELDFDQLD